MSEVHPDVGGRVPGMKRQPEEAWRAFVKFGNENAAHFYSIMILM
jgi:hypothetical protein